MNITLLRTALRKYGGWAVPFVGAVLLFHALRRRKFAAFATFAIIAALLAVGAYRLPGRRGGKCASRSLMSARVMPP